MHTRLFLLIAFVFSSCLASSLFRKITNFNGNEEPLITFVEKQGYKIEKQIVETDDGYMLTYHRIWPAKLKKGNITGYPVLLQHGLGTSSASFLVPDKNALAYVLADAGYDVWLGNSRGNRYSHSHKVKNSKSKEFWDYSLHDLGMLDMAAGVDRVLEVTGRKTLALLGHSHGATKALVLAASRPSYQPKISVLLALAPAVFLGPGHVRPAEAYLHFINRSISRRNISNAASAVLKFPPGLEDEVCKGDKNCLKILGLLRGTINPKAWEIIQQFEPAGTSRENLQEVLQQIYNGPSFKRFDYGPSKNVKVYKTESPPVYDLFKVNVPVHVYFAVNDAFITSEDIQTLKAALPNVTLHSVNDVMFNHFDFLWGPRAKTIVYENMISILNLYSSSQTRLSSKITIDSSFKGKSNSKLVEATKRFLRHLDSVYNITQAIGNSENKIRSSRSSAVISNGKARVARKNSENNRPSNTTQMIDYNAIQYLYDELKTLTRHAKYLNTQYKVEIKVTEGEILQVQNFDKLWETVFVNKECDKTCNDIFDNLRHIQMYKNLLNRPNLEVFSPKYITEANHEFFKKRNHTNLFKRSWTNVTDLSSSSVKHAITGLLSTISEARALVVLVNDIYNLFIQLSAHKKYLNNKFNVQITGNVSTGLEITNFNTFLTNHYLTTNNSCTFQCKEIRLIKDKFSKYHSLLNTDIINIDNPFTYIRQNILNVLMGAKNIVSEKLGVDLSGEASKNISLNETYESNDLVESIVPDTITENLPNPPEEEVMPFVEVDNLMDTLSKYLEHIKNTTNMTYDSTHNSPEFVKRDIIEIKSLIFKLNSSKEQHTTTDIKTNQEDYNSSSTENFESMMEKLKKYQSHIQSTYSLGGSKPANKDLGNIDILLKQLNETKFKCVGDCKEKQTLMKEICIFQDHIHKTYFNKSFTVPGIQCGETSIRFRGDSNITVNISNTEPVIQKKPDNDFFSILLKNRENKDLLNLTEKVIISVFNSITNNENQNKLYAKTIYDFYDLLRSLWMNRELLKSKYNIVVTQTESSDRLSINNINLLWNQVYDTAKGCDEQCKQIRSILDKVRDYKQYLTGSIIIDNPQSYLGKTNGEIATKISNSNGTKSNDKKLLRDDAEDTDDIITKLQMYQTQIQSNYGTGGLKTIKEDAVNINMLLEQLNKTKDNCPDDCKEKQSLMMKVCRFQTHILGTYFNKSSTLPGIKCDSFYPKTISSKDTNKIAVEKTPEEIITEPPNANGSSSHYKNIFQNNAEDTDNIITKLKMYQTQIQSKYGFGGSKPSNEDLSNINLFLKHLNKTKNNCLDNCEERKNLMQNICRFQRHIHATYFQNSSTVPSIKCDNVYLETAIIPKDDTIIVINNDKNDTFMKHLPGKLISSENFINTSSFSEIKTENLTSNNKSDEGSYLRPLNISKIETLTEKIQHSLKEEKFYIQQRLNKYLKHLQDTHGMVANSTSLTKDVDNIKKILKDFNETNKSCNGTCSTSKSFNQRSINTFLNHLHETYFKNNTSVDTDNSITNGFPKMDVIYKIMLHKFFHNNKDKRLVDLTNISVKRFIYSLAVEDQNKKVFTHILYELFDALQNLSLHKSYLSSFYNVSITSVGNLTITVEHINSLWDDNSLNERMCNQTCTEVKDVIKVLNKYKDELRSNRIEIDNPRVYLDEKTGDFLTPRNLENMKLSDPLSFNVKSDITLQSTIAKPHNDSQNKISDNHVNRTKSNQPTYFPDSKLKLLTPLFQSNGSKNVIYLSNGEFNEFINNLQSNDSAQGRLYIDTVNEIYDTLLKLEAYKAYIKRNYNVKITKTPQSRIVVKYIKNLFDLSLENKPCTDKCHKIKSLIQNLAKFKSLLSHGTEIQIDDPNNIIDKKQDSTKNIENPETFLGNQTRVSEEQIGSDTLKLSNLNHITIKLKKYLTHIQSTYNIGSNNSKTETDVNYINDLLKDISSVKQQCTGDCMEAQSLLSRIAKFQKHLSQTYHSNNTLDVGQKESIVIGNVPLNTTVNGTINVHRKVQNSFLEQVNHSLDLNKTNGGVRKSNNITDNGAKQFVWGNKTKGILYNEVNNTTSLIGNMKEMDIAIEKLQRYLVNTESFFNSTMSKKNPDISYFANLINEIQITKQNCTGNCTKVKELVHFAQLFKKYLNETYINKAAKTNINITKSDKVPKQPHALVLWLPLFHSNGSKSVIDLSSRKVNEFINNEQSVDSAQRQLYVDAVYETYDTLLKLEAYKTYLKKNYNIEFTKTPQSRIVVTNIKNLFELNLENKPCTGECLQIKSLVKTLEKFKYLFLYSTYIQIDYPSYIGRKPSPAIDANNNNTKVTNDSLYSKSSSMYSVDGSIKSLNLYLDQLKKSNTNVPEAQLSQDVKEIYNMVEKLNKIKEQGNGNEISELKMEVQQLKKYLHKTYSLSIEPGNFTTPNQQKSSSHMLSTDLWTLIRGNENSQVIDLTEKVMKNKLEGLSKQDDIRSMFTNAIYEIYDAMKKLVLYQDHLRTHFNIIITLRNHDGMELMNFNKIFSIYNESTCSDICIKIRLILGNIIIYKDLLNVSTLKIDNPATYVGTNIKGSQIKSNISSISDLNDFTVKLNNYLSHIKSTYNISAKASASEMDVNYINELLQDIHKAKRKCTGNCIEAQNLLKRLSMFQKHLNERYYSNNTIANGQTNGSLVVGSAPLNETVNANNNIHGQEQKILVGIYNQTVVDEKSTVPELSKDLTTGVDNARHSNDEEQYDSDLITNIQNYKKHLKSKFNIS